MGKKADEIAALREQVEALQAEVAMLRALPWWQQPGGGYAPGWLPAGGVIHVGDVPPYAGFGPNVCGCVAGVPQVITIDPQAAPLTFTRDLTFGATFGAAGCAPQQVYMVGV